MILFCSVLWLWGCGALKSQDTAATPNEAFEQPPVLGHEEEQYRQFALYIWQGLREYGIEGSFTAWFQKPEEEGLQAVALEKDGEMWLERFTFAYDQDSSWYTILSAYEPVMCGEPGNDDYTFFYQDEEEIRGIKDKAGYQMLLNSNQPLSVVPRFDGPAGAVIRDESISVWTFDQPSYVSGWEYLLLDERKAAFIRIIYPQIRLDSGEAGEAVKQREGKLNGILRDSFFYGYDHQEKKWKPEQEMWDTIDRSYRVTKSTDHCLSMRIYESNNFRKANHPNEWETGLTLNLDTGDKISLSSFLREEFGRPVTLDELLSSGVFEAQWIWSDGWTGTREEASRAWVDDIRKYNEKYGHTLETMEDYFYLTDTGLGLITFQGRYYTNIEARFDDLHRALDGKR